ncbi:ABC transporter ATP-binding protein [Chryseolinea lacunae]|uniref:ABC transporter ATP-binding protein n=1 Tax=Chryseolinea lacunae TaxID=2801331 RepID=A0ABS1L3I1_9BACT|nr:ABC transporter ATP-binding protein [Chryseolinea lacunae]MBL0745492.1 ABC transporter ATP-binding protein [Chryseolinea lacunae]
MLTLETQNLTHRFTPHDIAVNNVNLRVEHGSIYGFLGPNGAGKTTTLRLVLGLLRKQEGSIRVFGDLFEQSRLEVLRNVGSLIESPSLYGHLTARENLVVLQKVYRCAPGRVDEVLALVGLPHTGRKRVSQFSLGMKQRLAIAVALLPQPALLILDEPTNGLDPNGIIEIRELLKHLNQEWNTTILISSHLLAEIERLVTHVGIINKGTIMFQGTLDALRSKQQQSLQVVLDTSNPDLSQQLLHQQNIAATQHDGKLILPSLPKEHLAAINQQLVHHDIKVFEIGIVKNDLESIFIDLVK